MSLLIEAKVYCDCKGIDATHVDHFCDNYVFVRPETPIDDVVLMGWRAVGSSHYCPRCWDAMQEAKK